MTILFTSDTEFNSTSIIGHCNRPFVSTEEMKETLISNWNKKVSRHDTVYHLGDFCRGRQDPTPLVKRLNGNICLVLGNHDKFRWSINNTCGFSWIKSYYELKHKGLFFVLFHYKITNWNRKHYGAIHLYGHSHGNPVLGEGNHCMDVGVDCNNYTPVSVDTILAKFG